jgi:hypothetical protein
LRNVLPIRIETSVYHAGKILSDGIGDKEV